MKESLYLRIKERIKKIIEKDAFYIVLFMCICIVAASASWVSKSNLDVANKFDEMSKESKESIQSKDIDLGFKEKTQDTMNITKKEPEPKTKPEIKPKIQQEPVPEIKQEIKPITNPKKDTKSGENKDDTVPNTPGKKVSINMNKPVRGNIIVDYAKDTLIYSKTLDQWTTHYGVDIKVESGTEVTAALSGAIKSIDKTDELGMVITIDHGNGLITKYGNISEIEEVKIGQSVKKGEIISKVGNGSGFELLDGPHLHFEVIENGENINPNSYINSFK